MRNRYFEKGQRPIPPAVPRSEEHIDISGHLCVPVARSIDVAPEREGWVAWWVNVNLSDPIQKVVSYRSIYKAQSARDAQMMGYGGKSYWDYLEQSAHEHRDYFERHPELGIDPETMLTQSLSEALRGNEGI